jgi:hypothetical protein
MPEDSQDRASIRRMPSLLRNVSEISSEDMRVSLIGTVIDRQDNLAVIDDGTGQIKVSFENNPEVGLDKLVRVFGRVLPLEGGFELQGEIIQDMSGLDMGLLKRVNSISI